jgi:hypothetical protein
MQTSVAAMARRSTLSLPATGPQGLAAVSASAAVIT